MHMLLQAIKHLESLLILVISFLKWYEKAWEVKRSFMRSVNVNTRWV